MCITCSFRECASQIDAGPSTANDDVDDDDTTAFKPKTEPDSPSHQQHHPSQQYAGAVNNGAGSQSQSSSRSSVPGCEASQSDHVTSSHLLANHQLALPHHYQHQQMSSAHHPHHLQQQQQQQQHGYGCAMGLEGLGFAAAAAAQCASRSFTPTSPFAPAHRIGVLYYDTVRQAGFDNM